MAPFELNATEPKLIMQLYVPERGCGWWAGRDDACGLAGLLDAVVAGAFDRAWAAAFPPERVDRGGDGGQDVGQRLVPLLRAIRRTRVNYIRSGSRSAASAAWVINAVSAYWTSSHAQIS